MSWLFSQALVVEYLGENCLDGEPSAPLNGNPTQQAYLSQDKMTVFFRLSRFGMTFKPLTESRGEELLTLFRAGFPVKTSAQQEWAQESTESAAECGKKWPALLAKFDHDSHLWRTVQCSLLEDLNASLQTLPQWGTTVGGELYLLPTLVQTTAEKEFGLSPNGETFFHTPNTTGLDGVSNSRKALKKRQQSWPTPTANEDAAGKPGAKMQQMLGNHPKVRQDPNGGVLNPTWVEWLMGWPLGWTDLKPMETDKFHSVQQQLGKHL